MTRYGAPYVITPLPHVQPVQYTAGQCFALLEHKITEDVRRHIWSISRGAPYWGIQGAIRVHFNLLYQQEFGGADD